MPVGATTGDILVLVIEARGEDEFPDDPPSGGAWNFIGSEASSTANFSYMTRCSVYWAWYDAGINLTVPAAGEHAIVMVYAFRGVDSTVPIDATPTTGGLAAYTRTHVASTGYSTVTDGSMMVLAYTHGDGIGTIPSDWSCAALESANNGGLYEDDTASDGTVGIIYGIKTTGGAIGDFIWITVFSEHNAWVAFALRPDIGGGTNYDIIADTASYTTSGSAASLVRNLKISANNTSYSIAGTDASLVKNYFTSVETTSYTIIGQQSQLLLSTNIKADNSTYNLSAQDALLTTARSIQSDTVAYMLTGQAAELISILIYDIQADSGSFFCSASPAALVYARTLPTDTVIYTITGTDVILNYNRSIKISEGSENYTIIGSDVGVIAHRVISLDPSSYLVLATDVNLIMSATQICKPGLMLDSKIYKSISLMSGAENGFLLDSNASTVIHLKSLL